MTIRINQKSITPPSSFNDLSQKNLKQLFTIFSTEGALSDKCLALTKHLLRLSEKFMKQWEADAGEDFIDELDDVVKNTCAPFLDKNTLALTFTRPPFYKIAGQKAPAEMLKTSTFIEFATADKHYQDFLEDSNPESLLKVIACLYRNRKKPLEISENFQKFIKIPTWKKFAILHFFASCRNEIMERIPGRFTRQEGEEKHEGNDFGWAGVILSLTGDRFGTEEGVKNTNIWSIIVHLNMADEQIRKAKLKK